MLNALWYKKYQIHFHIFFMFELWRCHSSTNLSLLLSKVFSHSIIKWLNPYLKFFWNLSIRLSSLDILDDSSFVEVKDDLRLSINYFSSYLFISCSLDCCSHLLPISMSLMRSYSIISTKFLLYSFPEDTLAHSLTR